FFWREHVLQPVRILLHAAELGNIDRLAVLSHARVAVKYGTAVAALDADRENEIQPGKDNEKEPRRNDIERALEKEVAAIPRAPARHKRLRFRHSFPPRSGAAIRILSNERRLLLIR